jgi:hypothetical protein
MLKKQKLLNLKDLDHILKKQKLLNLKDLDVRKHKPVTYWPRSKNTKATDPLSDPPVTYRVANPYPAYQDPDPMPVDLSPVNVQVGILEYDPAYLHVP